MMRKSNEFAKAHLRSRLAVVLSAAVFAFAAFSGSHAATISLDPTSIDQTTGGAGSETVGSKTYNWDLGTCLSCSPNTDVYEITPNSNLGESGVEAITGDDVLLQYKDNVGGSEEGSFAGNYTTTFLNSPLDPEDALIKWDGGAFISDALWLEVKDGNHDPATYLFDIAGWDGMMDIVIANFWPNGGAISHVSIWGVTPIPVPAALPLFATALGGMGLLGWRRRRKISVAQ